MKILRILTILIVLMVIPCCMNNGHGGFKASLYLKSRTIPVVNIRISNHNIPMIIDTGSEITILDDDVYREIPQFFNIGDTVTHSISTINIEREQKMVSALTFINDSIKTKLYIMDIDNVCEEIFINKGLFVKGIIGCDFLYENGLTIDFKNKRLTNLN